MANQADPKKQAAATPAATPAAKTVAKKAAATPDPADQTPTDPTSPLVTEEGRTTISDQVVAKIAGVAVREIDGVHDLGRGAARAVGALRERIPGSSSDLTQGVKVEIGERQAAVDVALVADYGVSLVDLAAGVRTHVIEAVEKMTGLQVTEVNIRVEDLHIEGDTDEKPRVE